MRKPEAVKSQGVPIDWDCQGNDKLTDFLTCPADEVLFGGAAGGAKTEGLIIKSIGTSDTGFFNNPNWKVLFLRRTFPELENSAILRSQALLHDKAKYDGVKHRWTVPGGGLIQFGHIKNDDDLHKHHSAEYPLIIFDELTTFTERMYLYLFSRNRSRDINVKSQIRSGTNPGNLGHAWVKERFLKNRTPRQIYHSKKILPDGRETDWSQCFIPSSVFDNKFLMKTDPMYARRLMELPEIEREALLYGNWDIFSGQFFPEFSEDHMIDDFDVPNDWPFWVSLDWGYMSRCAVLFFTQDPSTKVIYLFGELYVKRVLAKFVAGMIKSKLGDKLMNLLGRYTDKRVMVKDEESGISTQEKFSFEGLYFKVVDTDRTNGWHRTRELLMKDPEGHLGFRVFRSCVNFTRTMAEAIFDEKNPDDMDKRGECHCPDALRYFAITRRPSDLESMRDERPVSFSSVTGYIGMRDKAPLLRNQVKRLRGLVRGKNYFMDRPK